MVESMYSYYLGANTADEADIHSEIVEDARLSHADVQHVANNCDSPLMCRLYQKQLQSTGSISFPISIYVDTDAYIRRYLYVFRYMYIYIFLLV